MPEPSTRDEFLDVVRESGVVDEMRLEAFLEQWYAVSAPPDDPWELAKDMLEGKLITPFQKGLLLQGKRRGYIIADKYVLLGHLGSGGMGSVYLCEHKVMRRQVAIKVLPTAFAQDPEYLQRFHREARAVAALDHPNIVRAYDVDHDGKIHFLVMEYVEGDSLHDLVSKEGPLDVQRAADYISQAAAGLQHAHEAGLVHRDIKPGNLLVDRKGTVKILDMGLALFFQEKESVTQQYDASAVLGTADYLAPEQVMDSHGVDTRADIYSLGLTFFFLLTRQSPYGEGTVAQKLIWHQLRAAKSVREFRPEVPEGLAAVLSKMIAKDPAERYQAPGEVVEALAPWVWGTAEPEEESEPPPAGETAIHPPPTEINTAEPTADTAASPSVTAPDSDTKGPPASGKRTAKASRAAKSGPANKRIRTSDKQRRAKAPAPGFWTPQRLILAGTGAGLFLLLCVGAVIWAIASRPGTKTAPPGPMNPAPSPPMARPPGLPTPPQPRPQPPPASAKVDLTAPPKDLAAALTMLKGTQPKRRAIAADWLAQAPVDERRRPEVARALDPLLEKAETREQAARALAVWATRDNVPSLVDVLDVKAGGAWRFALEALGRLKDEQAAAPVARQLLNPDRRPQAVKVLQALGPVAEKEVIKYLHHNDPGVRQDVADLLKGYRTRPDVLLAQGVADLGSADAETRRLAAEDVAKAKPDPGSKAEVAVALNPLLARDADPKTREAALDALDGWATRDNVPALIQLLDDDAFRDRAIALLARLKDERSVVPLAWLLMTPDRAKAGKALQDMGPLSEEVVKDPRLLRNRSPEVRKEVYAILKAVGTKASVPALELAAERDRVLYQDVQAALKAIKSRENPGK